MPAATLSIGTRSLPEAVADLEKNALTEALRKAHHHQGRAARLLGLSYHQFRGLYRKYRR
jgi:psp operon transcriptional activator